MGYLHIENLYRNKDILLFKECYALEKIHGTSAHLLWKDGAIQYSSGGSKHATFQAMFNNDILTKLCKELFPEKKVFIYGEAYGGSIMGASETYGTEQKFVVFDVQIDGMWLAVPQAEQVATSLGLEFVYFHKINCTIDEINTARSWKSIQADRNGMGPDKMQEGIVLRPLIEVTKNNGERVIAKHKNDIFMETTKNRDLTAEQLEILTNAEDIANEWVTPMRAQHIIGKFGFVKEITAIPLFIKYMISDVQRESEGEVVWSRDVERAIGKKAAQLYKQYVNTMSESPVV